MFLDQFLPRGGGRQRQGALGDAIEEFGSPRGCLCAYQGRNGGGLPDRRQQVLLQMLTNESGGTSEQ